MWAAGIVLVATFKIATIEAAAIQTNDVQSNSIPTSNATKVDKCSRMYICPPNFLRINQNCYYFSTEAVSWRTAFDNCLERKGTLAMIRNINQDNNIKSLLEKVPLAKDERWIGGFYDWEKMNWKWAKNAKEIKYLGFDPSVPQNKEELQWKCITLDPLLNYKWNARSCFQEKHYICQTKITKISNYEKKKFMRKFNANKDNKINEVLAPNLDDEIPEELKTNKAFVPRAVHNAAFARRNETVVDKRKGKNRKKKKGKNKKQIRCPVYYNGTRYDMPVPKNGRRKRKYIKNVDIKDSSLENLKSRVYYGGLPGSPLHPRILTEEFVN